ncbi:Sorbose reductase sou1 [Orbilia oligospora]|uniref:Sorbose reductase sou1 n=1 Tax=Orbilia oligospora TaxID=2813651 RepID=A0A7C8PTT4_ORBOL|nr:Sorbose reductase sou1 [Orbilia oligospora]KAF3217438.1 Sorbose reductase sou1 [Orbilia oligospora]
MAEWFQPGQQDGIFHHNNTEPPAQDRGLFSLLSLKGRTAVVTGAAKGIGYAVVEAFAEAGANVALWYNSNEEAVEKAAKVSEAYGVICKAYKVNVTDETSLKATLDLSVKDLNGRLDIFVANVGIPWLHGRTIDSPSEQFLNILNVNFVSAYYSAKAAGKYFERQKNEGTDLNGANLENYITGSFIVTSSTAGKRQLVPQAYAPYNATKAALTHFAKGLAIEYIQFARVNIVSPGYIATEALGAAPDPMRVAWKGRTPMGREGSMNEIKGAYVYLASDSSSFATGTEVVLDGGYTSV